MKKFLIAIIIAFSLFTVTNVVRAQYGLEDTNKAAKLPSEGTVPGIIGNVVGNLLTMVGVLFLVLMIYGGITWMLARGNEDQTKKALNTITAAVIGLIIVVASYAVTNFVFESVNEQKGGSGGRPCSSNEECGAGSLCVDNVCRAAEEVRT